MNDSFVLNTRFLRCQILWRAENYPRAFNNGSISNATTAKADSVLLWERFCQRLISVHKPTENAIPLKNKVKKTRSPTVLFQWFLFDGLNSYQPSKVCLRSGTVYLYKSTLSVILIQGFESWRLAVPYCCKEVRQLYRSWLRNWWREQRGEVTLTTPYTCNWSHFGGEGGLGVWKRWNCFVFCCQRSTE